MENKPTSLITCCLNLLIHGLDETTNTVWESKAETLATSNSFLKEGLDLDPNSITLMDAHRLPQRPIIKHGRRITRPIIIKLANAIDKKKIMTNLKHLKTYNEARRSVQDSNSSINLANQSMKRSIYVTEHLPKAFYEQKKKTYASIQESTSIRSIHQVVNRKW